MKRIIENHYQDTPDSYADKVRDAVFAMLRDKDLWNEDYVVLVELVKKA